MNIFILEKTPKLCAMSACDKHVVKMIVESLQLLMSAYYQKHGITTHKSFKESSELVTSLTKGFPRDTPYGLGFPHHPCTKWLLESDKNIIWLISYTKELCLEYTYRYGKIHKSQAIIEWFIQKVGPTLDTTDLPTPFAQAMPKEYMHEDPIIAYRTFYIYDKATFAKWTKRPIPSWYINGKLNKEIGLDVTSIQNDLGRGEII